MVEKALSSARVCGTKRRSCMVLLARCGLGNAIMKRQRIRTSGQACHSGQACTSQCVYHHDAEAQGSIRPCRSHAGACEAELCRAPGVTAHLLGAPWRRRRIRRPGQDRRPAPASPWEWGCIVPLHVNFMFTALLHFSASLQLEQTSLCLKVCFKPSITAAKA